MATLNSNKVTDQIFLPDAPQVPGLLFRAIRFRGLERKQWRLVLMRAVWGGPFGTLGALWDLCAEPPAETEDQIASGPEA